MAILTAVIIGGSAYWLYQKVQAKKAIRRAEKLTRASEIVSCLVDQVYAADGGHHEQASQVWEALGYVEHKLRDDQSPEDIKKYGKPSCTIRFMVFRRRDTNIRGTMEEWTAVRPQYVVAIRGTKPRCQQDIGDDILFFFEVLHSSEAFQGIFGMTENTVKKYEAENVCITGHSLGAAFGLLVGRKLALEDQFVETHLFNPPYLTWESLIRKPVRKVKETLSGFLADLFPRSIRAAFDDLKKSLGDPLKDILDSKADRELQEEMEREFSQLQGWTPNMYVNEHDFICNEYPKYYEKARENAEREEASSSLSTSKSSRVLRKVSLNYIQAKSYHLIPSVVLHKNNRRHSVKWHTPHKVNQWYKYPTLGQSTLYRLKVL